MGDRLKGRAAIVTGGAQGIGAAYAKALAAEGAAVAVADVRDCGPVAAAIEKAGGRALALECDVTDLASTEALAAKALEAFGSIDILVNNAAIFANLELKPFLELDPDEWDRVMAVNVRGPYLCARAVVPQMRKQRYGRIVNIASGTVFKGTPLMLHYVTSKGAVVAFSRSLAREVGEDGICVNTLAPGLVLSEGVQANKAMQEKLTAPVIASRAIKRDQTPEDLFGALIFLCSDDCAFMTGQAVVVDGGSVTH